MHWMTLPEIRDEPERTHPAWETTDPDGFLADGQLPVCSEARQHRQEVVDELRRRRCRGDAPNIQRLFSDDTQGNTRQSRSKPDAANMMQILQTLKGAPS